MSFLMHTNGNSHTLKRKIIVTGGGTGGHVFPVLAILEQLTNRYCITWIGSKGGIESGIVSNHGIDFIAVHAGKLRRYFSLRNIVDMFLFLLGIIESLCIISKIRPDIVFSKGGYVSLGPTIAAGILKVPIVTHESDCDPGLSTRINLKFTSIQCIAYEESRKYYSTQNIFISGNPIRHNVFNASADRARAKYALNPQLPILLVLGGSLGSRQINTIMKSMIPQILSTMQVVHQTGDKNFKVEVSNTQDSCYIYKDFFSDDYADLIESASLVLARSGAGVLWEIGVLRKPAVFIPLDSGSRGDQIRNAEYVEKRGASITVSNNNEIENLPNTLIHLIQDIDRLKSMSKAWAEIVHGNAAVNIAKLIENIVLYGVEVAQESLQKGIYDSTA